MLNSCTVPCGTPTCSVNSGARVCVGPRIKLPSTVGGGSAPSGSSVAVTYPGVCGSRSGFGGRTLGTGAGTAGFAAGAWPIASHAPHSKLIDHTTRKPPRMEAPCRRNRSKIIGCSGARYGRARACLQPAGEIYHPRHAARDTPSALIMRRTTPPRL